MADVVCNTSYMEIVLNRKYLPGDISVQSLHLNTPSCRSSWSNASTISLRTPLNSCGTTYNETDKTLIFGNKVLYILSLWL